MSDYTRVLLAEWHQAYPRMDIYLQPGRIVMFDAQGGYEGEKVEAKKALAMRGLYEVERINVGSSSSRVRLKGVDGWFNTVLFAAAPEPMTSPLEASSAQPAQQATDDLITECARRLLENADFALGGCLSASSKARDIPSNAWSQVKARHLAALRDALSSAEKGGAA